MTIRIKASVSGRFDEWVGARRRIAAKAVTAAVKAATEGLKLSFRQQIHAALMSRTGQDPGNMIGSAVYPKGRASLGPAGEVFARGPSAERILRAHTDGAVIRGRSGNLLAIPTENVPLVSFARGSRREATPVEVEAKFNRELRFVPLRGGLARGLLVMDELARRKSGVGFRQASKRRRAQGRPVESIVMFVLVAGVTLRKRLTPDALAAQWLERVPGLIERALPDS